MILGREPESDAAISAHIGLEDVGALRQALIDSKEFQSQVHAICFEEKWVCCMVYNDQYRMWVDLADRYVSHGCLHDGYEPLETAFIEANLREGQRALDVGANIGWHTLGMARRIQHGTVTAFEPRQPTNLYLKKTVEENNLDNTVEIFDFGLWDEESLLDLTWRLGASNPGHSHIDIDERTNGERQQVALKRLDDLGLGPVDFVKLDVEGAEPRVILGGIQLIKTNKPIILCEIYPEMLKSVGKHSVETFIRFMHDLDYQCFLLEPGHIGIEIEVYPAWIERVLTSVIFCPAGQKVAFPK